MALAATGPPMVIGAFALFLVAVEVYSIARQMSRGDDLLTLVRVVGIGARGVAFAPLHMEGWFDSSPGASPRLPPPFKTRQVNATGSSAL